MEKLFVRGTIYPIEDYLPEQKSANSPQPDRWQDWRKPHSAQILLALVATAMAGLALWFLWFVASACADADNLERLQDHWVNLLLGIVVLVTVSGLAARYLRPISIFLSTAIASSHPLPFDAAQWQSARYRNDSNDPKNTARVQMVDDLLRQHHLVGLSTTAVFALLGQPTEVSLFSEWDILYFLGPEPGLFSTSHLWLGFQLDEQRRVSNYQVVSD